MSLSVDSVYGFEGFTLDLTRGVLLSPAHTELKLRPKAFALLCLLVENAGRLMDRDTIFAAIWPKVLVTEDNITQCVREIRKVLGDTAQHLLRVVRGRGYILSTTVQRARPGTPFADQDGRTSSGPEVPPARWRGHAASLQTSLDLSLAVLPFQDLGSDWPQPSLAESITEDLRVDLSRWTCVIACPWLDLRGFGATTVIQAVAELGVRYLITGSLRQVSGRLFVTVRLVDGRTGAYLWADRFERDCTDPEPARVEISSRLAYTLRLVVMNAALQVTGVAETPATDAGLLCAQGWSVYNRSVSEIAGRRSLPYFHRALTMDPESADARLGIAAVVLRNVAHWWAAFDQASESYVQGLLLEALERDPASSRAYCLSGLLRRLQARMEESLVETEIAKDLDRNNVPAIRLHAYTLMQFGRPEAAIPDIEKSLRISANDVDVDSAYQVLGTCHLLLKDADRSIEFLRRSRAGNPRLYATHMQLVAALGLSGGSTAARVPWSDALTLKPELNTVARLTASIPCANPHFLGLAENTLVAGWRRAGIPGD